MLGRGGAKMFGWLRKKTPPTADEFHGIMLTLLVGGEQSLFVMLGADGSINRLGTGAVDNTDRDMYVGRTDPGVFRALREQITLELLPWCGQSRSPVARRAS
jgi:hypothetical protein